MQNPSITHDGKYLNEQNLVAKTCIQQMDPMDLKDLKDEKRSQIVGKLIGQLN